MQVLIPILILIVVSAFVYWQWNFIVGFWQDGGRGQFLVMGMPAVIFMVLGVAAMGLAAVNMKKLDSRYEGLRQRANENAQVIREDIIRNREMDVSSNSNAQAVIPEELREKLKQAQKEEKIYLDKLIDLDNNNDEYKFQMAMLAVNQDQIQQALSLLQMIAPFDEPGYAKAHLALAQHYLSESERAQAPKIRSELMRAAALQIKNCLIADESSIPAKRIKAYIHERSGQQLQAFEIYKELFEDDPIYYRQLLKLSTVLGLETDRKTFLDQASREFRQKTTRESDSVKEWTDSWLHYVLCMKLKRNMKSFDEAENAVKGEIQKYNDPTDIGKKVFLQRQLSKIYSDRAVFRGRDQPLNIQKVQLEDLANALENDKNNEAALQWLTILGTNPELSEEVKKIYDPQYDPNVPWVVLSELGLDALRRKDYENAILYFERARKKNHRNPDVLNNLAYALLVSPNPNPEQALLYVDQAISIVVKQQRAGQRSENHAEIVASFYDTRGVALMQLERLDDAAAAFEVAYKNRPKDQGILENLIKCYSAIGNERQAATFQRRLEKLKKDELQKPKN